jgi:hypothetical protein
MTKTAPKTVHTLKVTLRGVKPPVWRRIVVQSDTRLSELAAILESVMGWEGYHLHGFETADRVHYGPEPDDGDWGPPTHDERRFKVSSVLRSVKSKLRFDYDFGDGWEHDVVVEAIGPAERGVAYPRVIAGKRACPPEDCGGPWGYQNLLEALADPKHRDHDDLTVWVGDDFDPEHFEVPAAEDEVPTKRA